jgi:ABC-type glycerol-3-phosphate transport system permease component
MRIIGGAEIVNIKTEKRLSKKLHFRFSWGWFFTYLFMIALVAFTALPLVYVVSTAFKPIDELFIYPPRFFVRKPTMENFTNLLTALSSSEVPFTRYAFNSIMTVSITVVMTVIVSAMGAFSLVKYRTRGSDRFFKVVLAALMFSPHVTQIPTYMVINKLGMINSYSALIIPKIAVAYNFFLMKQFIEQLPDVLLEAARIDGATEWYTFWKIVMPSLKPAWATLVVFSFVANWNDYFSPLVFITNQAMKTLPLALQTIAGGLSIARAGAVGAATLLMTLPTVIIFTAMQARVMETMVHSGIKA